MAGKSKKIEIDVTAGTVSVHEDGAAAPGQLVQTPLTGPVPNNTLVKTAVIQTDFNTVAVAAESRYKQIAQQNIEATTRQKEEAVRVMREKEAALRAAVAQLPIPSDFVADAEALAAAFGKFYVGAVASGHQVRTPLRDVRPAPGATQPVAGLTVDYAAARTTVRAEIKADGEVVTRLTRDYPLDAGVTAANKELVEAQAAVARLDTRLVELAKEKQTATEKGRNTAAAAALSAMAQLAGGEEIINSIVEATNAQAAAAGLTVSGDTHNILAIAGRTPSRTRPTAQ